MTSNMTKTSSVKLLFPMLLSPRLVNRVEPQPVQINALRSDLTKSTRAQNEASEVHGGAQADMKSLCG